MANLKSTIVEEGTPEEIQKGILLTLKALVSRLETTENTLSELKDSVDSGVEPEVINNSTQQTTHLKQSSIRSSCKMPNSKVITLSCWRGSLSWSLTLRGTTLFLRAYLNRTRIILRID